MPSRVLRLLLLAALLVNGCGKPADPNEQTLRAATGYMRAVIRSSSVKDAVRGQDADLKASTCVTYLMSNADQKNWPQPGSGEGRHKIPNRPTEVRFAADSPPGPVCVVLKADDAKKHVLLQAFGQDTTSPVFTLEIPFGP
jgi:hypothetical protein